MNKHLEMYTQEECEFCIKAKQIIDKNPDMSFYVTEYNIDKHPGHRKTLQQRLPGVHSIPQIWIAGKHIGTYEDLADYIIETTSMG